MKVRLILWLLAAGCADPAADDAFRGVIPASAPCEEVFWWLDADGDGYGEQPAYIPTCEPPDGTWVNRPGDCDDADPRRNPGAPERCDPDGIDEDCDYGADDDDPQGAIDASLYFRDDDGDGFGRDDKAVRTCSDAPEAYVPSGGDCDDRDAQVHPGAAEPCQYDAIDEDCDGTPAHYVDLDGDGFGGEAYADCVQPMAAATGDCDDDDPFRNPAVVEVCGDGIDQDCDGGAGPCGIEDTVFAAPLVHGELIGAGDGDGDGSTDLFVSDHGSVYVHRGPFDGTAREWSDAWARIEGPDELSHAVLLDFDGDGRTDVAYPHAISVEGGVRVWLATASGGAIAASQGPVALLEARAMGAIDADGDGADELIVVARSSPSSTWRVVVPNPGPGVWRVDDHGVAVIEDVEGDVLDAGDLNGDGLADLAWRAGEGVALLHGPVRGQVRAADADVVLLAEPERPEAFEAHAIADVDGDGRDDLAVSSPPAGALPGVVYVHSELSDGGIEDADAVLLVAPADGVVASAGDLDGDGAGELLVLTSPFDPHLDVYESTALVLSGPLSGVVDLEAQTRARVGATGYTRVVGADLDEDGWSDLLLGTRLLSGGPGL